MPQNCHVLRIKKSAEALDIAAASCSPISPELSCNFISDSRYPPLQLEPYAVESVLKSKGYSQCKTVSEALQGYVYEALDSKDKSINIIKIANKTLYDQKITNIQKKPIKIKEDIIKEASILKHLTENNPPAALSKFVHFFEDQQNYFLVMEHGGQNLFDFVKDCHQWIDQGLISNNVWLSFCTSAMKQMVDCIEWMHNSMHCCHLDISLENFVISNAQMLVTKDKKTVVCIKDFQIKIIDFGLAELFGTKTKDGNINFACDKYCGKTGYKAPKVYGKRHIFDARSADCWSLGVSFFMMVIGAPPFSCASPEDAYFRLMTNGHLIDTLYDWDRIHYVNRCIVDLLCRIFVEEKYRLDIREIQSHPCFL